MEREVYIVVGLGNYGTQYAHTRHNVGFDVTDLLASRLQAAMTRDRCRGKVAEIPMENHRTLVLCQPQTYMNLSGECVSQLLSWYKCPPERLLVICDDIDLPQGKLRLRRSGSPGTHNGLRNISAMLPGTSFPRLRVGVGAPPPEWDLVDWVLSRYLTREEQDLMQGAFARAADCALDWLHSGVDHAMCHFNG